MIRSLDLNLSAVVDLPGILWVAVRPSSHIVCDRVELGLDVHLEVQCDCSDFSLHSLNGVLDGSIGG